MYIITRATNVTHIRLQYLLNLGSKLQLHIFHLKKYIHIYVCMCVSEFLYCEKRFKYRVSVDSIITHLFLLNSIQALRNSDLIKYAISTHRINISYLLDTFSPSIFFKY